MIQTLRNAPLAYNGTYKFDVRHIDYLWFINYTGYFKVCQGRERFGRFGCYDIIVKPSGKTWYEAKNYCADMGKALLAIETAAENDAVKSYLQANEGKSFICYLLCHMV